MAGPLPLPHIPFGNSMTLGRWSNGEGRAWAGVENGCLDGIDDSLLGLGFKKWHILLLAEGSGELILRPLHPTISYCNCMAIRQGMLRG